MRAWNRAKLLWAYLRKREYVPALPVEYIVETTAKCNLYCPMCPRETHKQPKEDMTDEVFERLVAGARRTGEHMMLIGLGEPFLDAKIFDRIEFCEQHKVSTLLSTNGTLLDEEMSRRLLATPLKHITLSFDGATKESFEFYRKGARFEKVRANFVRFCELKKQLRPDLQVVVQMVRMEKNWDEVEEFSRFWKAVPGVDQVRIKADETNLMQPEPADRAGDWKHPCHYLWRGPAYVKHNGDVYPCCQSYMLDGAPVGNLREQELGAIFNSPAMRELRRKHIQGRAVDVDMCARCCTAIPHPVLVAGSLLLHGEVVRKLLPLVERVTYGLGMPLRLLKPQRQARGARQELVQIR